MLGTGDRHVGEPALFFEVVLVPRRACVGENPFLHRRDEDDRELEPLCGVDRHDEHPPGVVTDVV